MLTYTFRADISLMLSFLQAALNALQDLGVENCSHVEQKHFIQALSAMSPSLSREQVKSYENMALSC